MKNELKIPGCDYWGEYNGYKVFKCYSKDGVSSSAYPNIVFAIGNNLFMNGGCVGKVDDVGRVSNWAPSKWVKKEKSKPKTTTSPVEFDTTTNITSNASDINVDEILNDSWKRTVEELVGEKFSVEYKYSE